jgi:DNA-binding PadR family transcriptional regulator
MSTLAFALLATLARAPHSGYDLAQRLKHDVAPFWHAAHSHIYPELTRLLEQHLVSVEHVAQDDRPDKKRYAITPAGRAALRGWLAAPTRPRVLRDELVLKAYAAWMGDRAAVVAQFREHERLHRERLAHYEAVAARMEQQYQHALTNWRSPTFASYATLRRGISFEREYVAWCRWLADQVEGQPADV